jgi:phenylalanyl-tRNA synthetase beta chain
VRILVSWLRDHVEVPAGVPVRDLAWAMNLLGFEVASIEPGPSGADDDAVIDFEITANRPDALSVFGIAREVSTHYGTPLRDDVRRAVLSTEGRLPLEVTIEAPDLCPRYSAAMLDVELAPSPPWLVQRLAAAGVRAINNVVDATNYVMLELGHPLHAFDYERLHGSALRIRRARDGERMTTLDGVERTLDGEMLVIADAERATAIAGVMGGGDSEVSASTRRIALESAYFVPQSVRRTSKRLGLSTEASYRFERGADPEAPVLAVSRACQLLEQIGAGRVLPGLVDAHPAPRPRGVITLRASRVAGLLGHEVAAADVERILRGLGFEVEAAGGAWRVTVPSWRGDVSGDADLIEEIARHDGYEKLPIAFPALRRAPDAPDARLAREAFARRLALGAGFSECVTFTFVERAAAAAFADESRLVPIANPLSEKFAVLRPSLLPGLVDAVSHNRRREQRDVMLFETGARFARDAGEVRALGLAWTGAGSPPHWSDSTRAVDFFDIKGALELVCEGFGLAPAFVPLRCAYLVAGRAAAVTLRGEEATDRLIGIVGELEPRLAAARGLPAQDPVYVAELDLDGIAATTTLGTEVRVQPLPKHPSIVRDLSIVVRDHLPAAELRATIQQSAPPTLVDVIEFARYQGRGVPDGQVSLSFRLTFRAPDRTLTDQEVQAAFDTIVAALGRAHDATLR